jgi:hypothetical protein
MKCKVTFQNSKSGFKVVNATTVTRHAEPAIMILIYEHKIMQREKILITLLMNHKKNRN